MNAFELADLIGLCGDGGYNQDAANMLRQQADRIAELEKYVGFKESGYDIIQLTPQTKPLSDEEICNLWLENSYGLPLCNIAFEYARAIEERHGIK